MIKLLFLIAGLLMTIPSSVQPKQDFVGQSEILKWQYGKNTAISITYDGGTINQFKVALPVMNELDFKATFFIVTGDITGSQYQGKFIGRSVEEIIQETVKIPLNEENFFERATAVRFLGYDGPAAHHTRAGDFFELGKFGEAYSEIDEAYQKVRHGEYKPLTKPYDNDTVDVSWVELKEIAEQGHEFASHSVSHPQFAICDDVNMKYELEKSREELLNHLGTKHTFSHECPHGSENPRVMRFSLGTYPALRNRMPEKFLEELNRWTKKNPCLSDKEYVQWQRGPKTKTSMKEMKSWVDTCLESDNIWLVLVFHGVNGIGYQPKTGTEIKDYFSYIKSKEDKIWVATFQDVTKYMRQRTNAEVETSMKGKEIIVKLTHNLDPELYDLALTLKTYIPASWGEIKVRQGENKKMITPESDEKGDYVIYTAYPGSESVILSEL